MPRRSADRLARKSGDLSALRERYEELKVPKFEVVERDLISVPAGSQAARLAEGNAALSADEARGLMGAREGATDLYARRYVSLSGFAAADWEYVIPAGFDARFVMGTAILHASATVGNRFLGFHVYDDSSGVAGISGKSNKLQFGVPNAQAVAAGQSGNAHYYRGETLISAGLSAMVPVPDALLPAGWSIGSESFPLAGDTWTQITFLLELYLGPLPNL